MAKISSTAKRRAFDIREAS